MAIGITISITDEAAVTASTSFNVSSETTLEAAGQAAQAIALLIDGMVDGRVSGISLSYPIDLPAGLKATALDTARAFAGVRFTWETDDGYITRMNIPTRKESIVVDGSKSILTAVPPVSPFLAAMSGGIDLTTVGGVGTIAAVDTHDSEINVLLKAVESSKSS